jgi:uncharacterized membrane protein YccF (DUF307 family)
MESSRRKRKFIMRILGNIIWFVFGGLEIGLGWIMAGVLWSITIVGIPLAMQCFKFAKLTFFPFGKEIIYAGGVGSTLLNILWLIFSGIPLAVCSALTGLIFCVTIIGIPFGRQHFKIAKLALMPFGSDVV